MSKKEFDEMQAEIDAKTKDLENLQDRLVNITDEIDDWTPGEDEVTKRYEDMLDSTYGTFMGMDASYIQKECDPTGYDVGMADYEDGLEKEEFLEYRELLREKEDLEYDIENIEGEIDELETEILDIEEDDND